MNGCSLVLMRKTIWILNNCSYKTPGKENNPYWWLSILLSLLDLLECFRLQPTHHQTYQAQPIQYSFSNLLMPSTCIQSLSTGHHRHGPPAPASICRLLPPVPCPPTQTSPWSCMGLALQGESRLHSASSWKSSPTSLLTKS